jgi:hypothetical protein
VVCYGFITVLTLLSIRSDVFFAVYVLYLRYSILIYWIFFFTLLMFWFHYFYSVLCRLLFSLHTWLESPVFSLRSGEPTWPIFVRTGFTLPVQRPHLHLAGASATGSITWAASVRSPARSSVRSTPSTATRGCRRLAAGSLERTQTRTPGPPGVYFQSFSKVCPCYVW